MSSNGTELKQVIPHIEHCAKAVGREGLVH